MNEWYAEFTNTRYSSSKGRSGKEVKKLCEKSGMKAMPKTIRVAKAPTRGYIFNPSEPVDSAYAIVTRRRDESEPVPIDVNILDM